MKKALIIIFLLFFAATVSAAEKKPKGPKLMDNYIAVFDLETTGKIDKDIIRPLSESIRREVVMSGKWEVIDRGNMNKILGEQKFQLSGCVAGQCIVEAGQMLGVGKIITGSIGTVGKTYYLSLSLINVETGKIENVSEDECECRVEDLIKSSKRLVKKLLGEKVEASKETTSEPETSEPVKSSFSLEEFELKAKEETKKKDTDRNKQNKKTEQMKLAFNKVEDYEKKDISNDLKANAWKHFADSFKEDNPYSTEDDRMRQKAKEQNEYYTAMAKKPASTQGTFTTDTSGIEMVFVKGGCYQMGCGSWTSDCYDEEKPVHEVCVDDFYIGKYEVTQGQWKAIMGSNPSSFSSCGDNCPVEKVSWNDIQDFLNKLNSKTGKSYRLLTEAEWEYAARSGGKNEKYSGGNDIDSVAWYDKNSGSKTHPVGQKAANGLGIYDMTGNVWEWVNDWYGSSYYSESLKNNPKGPNSGSNRVLRGGSWDLITWVTRTAYRGSYSPDGRDGLNGFRLARTQ